MYYNIQLTRNLSICGPYTTEMIGQYLERGELSIYDHATKAGQDDWQPLWKIPEFQQYIPPPAAALVHAPLAAPIPSIQPAIGDAVAIQVPVKNNFARDLLVIFGASEAAGFCIGYSNALGPNRPTAELIGVLALMATVIHIVGFAIAGSRTRMPLWPYIWKLALGIWVLGFFDLLVAATFESTGEFVTKYGILPLWLQQGYAIAFRAVIGGAIAACFHKKI